MAPITQRESRALWHAVDALRWQIKAMEDMPDLAEHLKADRWKLVDAKAALRKVQAQVRAGKKRQPIPQGEA